MRVREERQRSRAIGPYYESYFTCFVLSDCDKECNTL
jgi:hypothetical protein